MAKLYFRYGTVGSAKTMNMLAVAYNYRQQGKEVIAIKPEIDKRWGETSIRSRSGLETEADIILTKDGTVPLDQVVGKSCLLVDEVQFLSTAQVENLHAIARDMGVPVICYGLRTDFTGRLFDGSRRLMELADTIEEIKTICYYCERKATFTERLTGAGGGQDAGGATIDLGGDEKYRPVCKKHHAATGGRAKGVT